MPRILAIADEVDRSLDVAKLKGFGADLVLSCGDLPFDYLEYVVTAVNKPLLYVPGNHDPELKTKLEPHLHGLRFDATWASPPGPEGCVSVDGRIDAAAGLRIAGLGGSIRYRPGANQYTQRQMRRRALGLEVQARRDRLLRRGPVDVLVTHSPPSKLGDQDDRPHRGFTAFHRLLRALSPKLMVHGHIHPFGIVRPDRQAGDTRIVNVVPHKILEIEP